MLKNPQKLGLWLGWRNRGLRCLLSDWLRSWCWSDWLWCRDNRCRCDWHYWCDWRHGWGGATSKSLDGLFMLLGIRLHFLLVFE